MMNVHPTAQVERASCTKVGSIDADPVWKNVGERAFRAELAVSLRFPSASKSITRRSFSAELRKRDPIGVAYLLEILARGVLDGGFIGVHEGTSLACLTGALSEELARNMRGA